MLTGLSPSLLPTSQHKCPSFSISSSPSTRINADRGFQFHSFEAFSVFLLESRVVGFLGRKVRIIAVNMLICYQVMRRWVSRILWWVSTELQGYASGLVFMLVKNFALALLTCIFAVGGASIGAITGAIKGQTTETGFFRGVGVGAMTGAITGVQLMELVLNGEPFSKVAFICSLVNGKIFMEWVSPAVLKAYQWQISNMEMGLREMSDIFEVNSVRGLSLDTINKLPLCKFYTVEATASYSETGCAICLQDLKDGEHARLLPNCGHFFHPQCIDEWLTRQGTCPTCRKDVYAIL